LKTRALLFLALALGALACLNAASAKGAMQAQLGWQAPQGDARWTALSTVNTTVTYVMSSVLKAMVGHRADPVYIIEDRTRTYSSAGSSDQLDVDDVFARRHGGPHPDNALVQRSRKQIIAFEQGGQVGIEPYLCKAEPPLNDADPNPKSFSACASPEPAADRRYQDPGDAALAQLPGGPVQIGKSWSFTRFVTVGREFASGSLTYVDTVQGIDTVDGQQIADIDVAATGRVDLASDLEARGFHTGTMSFTGTAAFNMTTGMPAAQHYTGHAEWHASILGANIGLVYDEVYEGKPWTSKAQP
jgi:hypothetical protein